MHLLIGSGMVNELKWRVLSCLFTNPAKPGGVHFLGSNTTALMSCCWPYIALEGLMCSSMTAFLAWPPWALPLKLVASPYMSRLLPASWTRYVLWSSLKQSWKRTIVLALLGFFGINESGDLLAMSWQSDMIWCWRKTTPLNLMCLQHTGKRVEREANVSCTSIKYTLRCHPPRKQRG